MLLVHWSPGCGFCTQIASELARLEDKLRARKTELVLVSAGGVEANRAVAEEHRLTAPVLLQEEQIAAFSGIGTPAAYLLDEEGRVAAPLALGANEVPELAAQAASGRKILASERTLDESRIEREGLKPGTRASRLRARGRTRRQDCSVRSSRRPAAARVFRSRLRPVQCAPPRPRSTAGGDKRRHGQPRRSSREPIKAEEHGLDFPVAVQKGWTLSKEYGIFAIPVAFLIEDGVISRPVARGKEEIIALAAHAGREAPLAH